MSADLQERCIAALERHYPGRVRRAIDVMPVAVTKTIDNEAGARETIRRCEAVRPMPAEMVPAASEVYPLAAPISDAQFLAAGLERYGKKFLVVFREWARQVPNRESPTDPE